MVNCHVQSNTKFIHATLQLYIHMTAMLSIIYKLGSQLDCFLQLITFMQNNNYRVIIILQNNNYNKIIII